MHGKSNKELRLEIKGLDEIKFGISESITHVVSLVDPGTTLPKTVMRFDSKNRLRLYTHDTLDSQNGLQAPSIENVKELCLFADQIDFSSSVNVLVHCHMGRSRSAAAAAILLLRLGVESPTTVFQRLQRIRSPIWPNWTFIENSDAFFGYNGELLFN